MTKELPILLSIFFAFTTFATLLCFYWVVRNSRKETVVQKANSILSAMIAWLMLQAVLTIQQVYTTDTNAIPPKIMLWGIFPTIIIMVVLFNTIKGKQFIDSLPLKQLTYLNTVRVPVELVLFWLFLNQYVPQLMTFEGQNYDILAGLSAPLIAYLGFTKKNLSNKFILVWNFICLGLLINIIVLATLSARSPFQQFGFEQPNLAILEFPFSWLPTFIVPLVLFGHLTSIRQLLKDHQE
jgi:hypothetical protein